MKLWDEELEAYADHYPAQSRGSYPHSVPARQGELPLPDEEYANRQLELAGRASARQSFRYLSGSNAIDQETVRYLLRFRREDVPVYIGMGMVIAVLMVGCGCAAAWFTRDWWMR